MALVYDNTRSAKDGGGWIEWSGPLDNSEGGWLQEIEKRRQDAAQRYELSKRRHARFGTIATIAGAAPFALAAAPALTSLGSIGAGGSASLPAAATAGVGFSAAPAATSLSAAVPWLKLAELGVGTGFNIAGNRAAGKASDRANALELEGLRNQQANMEKLYALEREEFEADQEQKRLDRAAADEERAFSRKTFEDKEGRRAPYRTVSRNALFSLADIARVGRS